VSVCLSVSLRAYVEMLLIFVRVSYMVVAWFSSGEIVIRYVLTVLWITSFCFHAMTCRNKRRIRVHKGHIDATRQI